MVIMAFQQSKKRSSIQSVLPSVIKAIAAGVSPNVAKWALVAEGFEAKQAGLMVRWAQQANKPQKQAETWGIWNCLMDGWESEKLLPGPVVGDESWAQEKASQLNMAALDTYCRLNVMYVYQAKKVEV